MNNVPAVLTPDTLKELLVRMKQPIAAFRRKTGSFITTRSGFSFSYPAPGGILDQSRIVVSWFSKGPEDVQVQNITALAALLRPHYNVRISRWGSRRGGASLVKGASLVIMPNAITRKTNGARPILRAAEEARLLRLLDEGMLLDSAALLTKAARMPREGKYVAAMKVIVDYDRNMPDWFAARSRDIVLEADKKLSMATATRKAIRQGFPAE